MASNLVTADDISCLICLSILTHPVTIPCGHNYCMGCIKNYWDRNTHNTSYSCPQCRKIYIKRPTLGKNAMLADLVERLNGAGLQVSPPARFYAGLGDVACNVCTGRKLKAVKTCMVCLVSYCTSHLQNHLEVPELRRHNLVNPTGAPEGKICPRHNRVLEIYCRTDQTCVCSLCVMDEHRNHDTISAVAGREEKQTQLVAMKRRSEEIIQEGKMELQRLEQSLDSFRRSAHATVEEWDRVLEELIGSIQRRHAEVKEQIRVQEMAEASKAKREMERLNLKISSLRERDNELKQLSHTQDHVLFLQRSLSLQESLSDSFEDEDMARVPIHSQPSFWLTKEAFTRLKARMEQLCKESSDEISKTVSGVHIFQWQEPKTKPKLTRSTTSVNQSMAKPQFLKRDKTAVILEREKLLQYACELLLDPNTAHKSLSLTEGNRKVKSDGKNRVCTNGRQRFDCWEQVMCSQAMTGARCYWEVEWSGKGVFIGVAYECLGRKGRGTECGLGHNANSWILHCSNNRYSAFHNNEETTITVPVFSPRVGVYLDHQAGSLIFYSVSTSMTVLHRVQTTFSQPLYPAFGLGLGSTLRLWELKDD